MQLKLSHCTTAYKAMKKRALKAYNKGDFKGCYYYLDKAAVLACQVIWRYGDAEMEAMLAGMAQQTIKQTENYQPNSNRVVFFDSFGVRYILTIQYVKALVAMGIEVLYVYEERNHAHTQVVPAIDFIKDYPSVRIEVVEQQEDKTAKFQQIYDLITGFSPSKIFSHIDTHSALIPVLSVLPEGILKYHINLGDHLYWLGAGFIDYTYEFRSFGAVVSQEKRGLKPEQTLFLPYYPITEDKNFLGFPEGVHDKVVIFTGGDFYKTIDRDNSYWELLRSILSENPQAIVLFAGKLENGNAPLILRDFIAANQFEERIIPLGFRPDINEVFKHCDIYMGTCPMSGGLMSQYAAVNAKPILQYYPPERFPDNETESVICIHRQMDISFVDKRKFLDEAQRLIQDKSYREKRGEDIRACMIDEDDFNRMFAKSLTDHRTPVDIEKLQIHYDALTNWWIAIGNKGYFDVFAFIFEVLGHNGFLEVPAVSFSFWWNRNFTTKLLNASWYRLKLRKITN